MTRQARSSNRNLWCTVILVIAGLSSGDAFTQESNRKEEPVPQAQQLLQQAESLIEPLGPSYRDTVLQQLVGAYLGLGKRDHALRLANQLHFVPYRQNAITQVAKDASEAGDQATASRIIQDFKRWLTAGALPLDPATKLMPAKQREMTHVQTVITCLRDIGTAQVSMGDSAAALQTCAEALNWIGKLDVPEQGWVALRDLAAVQAIAGDLDGALRSVRNIPDAGRKSEALFAVLQARANAGDAEGVLRMLESDLADSPMGMLRISVIGQLAARTDSQAVNALLDEMRSKAGSPEQREQIELLIEASMFDSYLQADDFEAARQLLGTITDAESKARFALRMAEKQSQAGDVAGALETINSLPSPDDRIQSRLAMLYAESGAIDKAREALAKLPSPPPDPLVYLALAEGYATTGDSEAAVAQLDKALHAAKGLPAYQNPDQYNGRAAVVHAKLGNYDRAVELLESTTIGSDYAWQQAAVAAAQTNGVENALTLVDKVHKPVLKAYLLIGLAESSN